MIKIELRINFINYNLNTLPEMKNLEVTRRSSSRCSSGGRTLRNGKIIADQIKKVVPAIIKQCFES